MNLPLATIRHLTIWYTQLYHVTDLGIIIGVKRHGPSTAHQAWKIEERTSEQIRGFFPLPRTKGLTEFKRTRPAQAEVQQEMDALIASVKETGASSKRLASPILPLSPGHLGMALASGTLDGLITLDDGRTVVIRGISKKESYKVGEITNMSSNSKVNKVTWSEQCVLKIRTIDSHGVIEEYKNQ